VHTHAPLVAAALAFVAALRLENFFTLPNEQLDPKLWFGSGGIQYLRMPKYFIALRLLFYPERGLLFYYPIFFLSFIGLYYMYKKFKLETVLIIFIFFSFLIMNSSLLAWWGGTSFSTRHLLPVIPFFSLPLIFVFEKSKRNKILRKVIFILVLYSITVNFIGLQSIEGESKVLYDIKTVGIANLLYNYYIPQFLEYGPRSRLFENIINQKMPVDIRYLTYEQREAFDSFYFNVPFLSLIPLIIFYFIIWRKEIFSNNKLLRVSLIVCIFIIVLIFLEILIKTIDFDEINLKYGWYPKSPVEGDWRWMKDNSIIVINNYENRKEVTFMMWSFYRERNITIFINDKLYNRTTISTSVTEINIPMITGTSTIKIYSEQKCDIPYLLNISDDRRCISIGMGTKNG
jgi:hypothetical protein